MTVTADSQDQQEFFPPTTLEKSARALGADTVRYRIDYLMLAMRDSIRLATVVIRPKAEGQRPTLLIRSPYAFTSFTHLSETYKPLFKNEYAMVLQNERGSEWSEGEFGYLTGTTNDAMDTLDWIAEQDWSNGRVGAHGCSSTAENQLKLGAIGHPALRACVPMSSGAGIGSIPGTEGCQGLFFRGGVPMLGTWALWHAPFGIRNRPKIPDAGRDEMARISRRFSVSVPDFRQPDYAAALAKSTRQAPSAEVLRRMGSPLTGFEQYMAGPTTPAWDTVDLIHAEHTGATPALNINGWMDVGAYETVKLFEFQQHHPEQYLIMAPTEHCKMTVTAPDAKLGDRPVGDSTFPYDEITASWFDRLLRDVADDWKPMPKVQVFLMGASTWLVGDTWPLPETAPRELHLTSAGSANTLWGDGALVPAAGAEGADHFIADPHNPVPSVGGDLGSDPSAPVCADQRSVECRADVLVYSTPVLDEAVAIAGDVSAELYISADVPDTESSSSWSTSIPTAWPTTWPRPRSGCATGTAWSTRPTWCPARSTGSRCAGSPRRTTSRPGTGSGSRSRARASRSPTGTGIPAAPTSTRLKVRSPASRCTTGRSTRPASSTAPTPGRSRSARSTRPQPASWGSAHGPARPRRAGRDRR